MTPSLNAQNDPLHFIVPVGAIRVQLMLRQPCRGVVRAVAVLTFLGDIPLQQNPTLLVLTLFLPLFHNV